MPQQPLPAGGRSREEIARQELGHTVVTPKTVRLLLVFFLTMISAVPALEVAYVIIQSASSAQNGNAVSAWSHLSALRQDDGRQPAAPAESWDRLVAANRSVMAALTGFERTLEDESIIGQLLRPAAQRALTRWLGAGNEQVHAGREGWIFYRPDVEYLTRPGFLEATEIDTRVSSAPEWETPPQPDPRPAILRFRDDLRARGIELVVVPTPVKPGVHPEMLAGGYRDEPRAVIQNPSFDTFVNDLGREGVRVFDPSDVLEALRQSGPQYLARDTHWRPESMETVAHQLGIFLNTLGVLPPAPDPGFRVQRVEVRNAGDAARMLDVRLFPAEVVWLRRVLQPDGAVWRPSRDADVLLLGDSFTNIYALESMGWGTGAGFAEQLSYAIRRPVDRLVQNDEGAFATRALLRRDPDRLTGKRVVVYQFAVRELAFGDWKEIALPIPTQ